MFLKRVWARRALSWMSVTAGAALALGCSGGVPAETTGPGASDANHEHLGDGAELDEIDGTGEAGASGQPPAQDQAAPAAAGAIKAAQAITSSWDCFGKNGRFIGRTGIWWGNTPADGTWACNEWNKEACSAAGGCVASGGSNQCDVSKRTDGCSLDWGDPTTVAYREIFKEACNAHDTCYHAPWDRISDFWSGFNKCNDNFWRDMNAICNAKGIVGCGIVASVWADAMNFDPGRTKFSDSFAADQRWMNSNCQR